MTRELFVYWKVDSAQAAAATAAAAQLQRALQRSHPGLQMRLYQRSGGAAHQATLMETYAHADGIGAALQADIEAAAVQHLQSWRGSQRHAEVFEHVDRIDS